jgi:hypothetical protein
VHCVSPVHFCGQGVTFMFLEGIPLFEKWVIRVMFADVLPDFI